MVRGNVPKRRNSLYLDIVLLCNFNCKLSGCSELTHPSDLNIQKVVRCPLYSHFSSKEDFVEFPVSRQFSVFKGFLQFLQRHFLYSRDFWLHQVIFFLLVPLNTAFTDSMLRDWLALRDLIQHQSSIKWILLFLLFPDTFGLMLDQVPSELSETWELNPWSTLAALRLVVHKQLYFQQLPITHKNEPCCVWVPTPQLRSLSTSQIQGLLVLVPNCCVRSSGRMGYCVSVNEQLYFQ